MRSVTQNVYCPWNVINTATIILADDSNNFD